MAQIVIFVTVFMIFLLIGDSVKAIHQATFIDALLRADLIVKGLGYPRSMAFLNDTSILGLPKDDGTVRRVEKGIQSREPVLQVNTNNETGTCCRGLLEVLALICQIIIVSKQQDRDFTTHEEALEHIFSCIIQSQRIEQ